MVKTVIKLIGLTFLLIISFMLLKGFIPQWVSSEIYSLLAIYFLLTLVTARVNIWAVKRGNLVVIFIASQVFRIVLSLLVIYIFITWRPAEANALVINFFIIYLFYLIFEIIEVLSNLRAEFRRPE